MGDTISWRPGDTNPSDATVSLATFVCLFSIVYYQVHGA